MSKPISAIILLFLLTSCNQGAGEENTDEGEATAPHQYYYFPKANVYIDSANNEYVFLANDGKTWQTAKQIPSAMQALMDKNVFIENPSEPVWEDNENHRLVYSALLYATPNDTTKKEVPKPTVSTQPKPSKDTVAETEKERKGLRKFFDKIFGKKKNKHKAEEEQNQE
ncbi:MAG TPA: hypothetical protein VGN63_01510 [Flavisolibacter sp.]|jgi:hypothetical protein|nr:hypothetical protein [Flavisolibacter sp.]